MLAALPLHPAINHFPVVASVLAAASLVAGALRPRAERPEWVVRSLLLLGVTLLSLPLVVGSGWKWASVLNFWPHGHWLPPRTAQNGLLLRHVIGGLVASGLAVIALLLGLRHRVPFWPFLLVVLLTALAFGFTAHLGGQMVYGEPNLESEPR